MQPTPEILEEAAEEIATFERWFVAQGHEYLAKFETAILKTYLVAKSQGKLKQFSPQKGRATAVESVDVYVLPVADLNG